MRWNILFFPSPKVAAGRKKSFPYRGRNVARHSRGGKSGLRSYPDAAVQNQDRKYRPFIPFSAFLLMSK
jgi:hypothetical protein